MTWAALGLAVTALGLAIRMIHMNGQNKAYKARLDSLILANDVLLAGMNDIADRYDERIKILKGKNNELLKLVLESSEPDSRRKLLNGLLQADAPDDPDSNN